MNALLIAAAVIAGHVDVTLTWAPPAFYEPPSSMWEDRCEPPTTAVQVGQATPLQYRIEATNAHGWAQSWIVDTGQKATVRLPAYDEASTNTITVVAEYADAPHESEPSCAVVYVTLPHRPAPTGLRIVAAEATVASGLPPVAMTLAWRVQDAFVPDQIGTSPGPVPEMPQ